jgi:hypothetical protein
MSSVIEPLVDPVRVARLLGIEVETLGVWRRRGFGPPWYRIGKKVKYSLPDVQTWMAAQASADRPTSPADSATVITCEQLTAILARKIMGWAVGPDRFLKGERKWSPRWHFQPLRRVDQALELLEKAGGTYTFEKTGARAFKARVAVGDRSGVASGKSKAATITVALSRAIRINVPDELLEACEG